MELNALKEARKQLELAKEHALGYRPQIVATAAGWSLLAVSEALVAYLQSKTIHKGDDLR